MRRRTFLKTAAGLFIPAIVGQAAIPSQRRVVASAPATGGEPVSPLDDPDIWGFWRSDTTVYYDAGDNNKIEGPSYPAPTGWHDTTPNDRVLQPNVSENGARVVLADVNGNPSISFVATSNHLFGNGLVTLAQPYSVFLLLRIGSDQGFRIFLDSQDGAGNKGALYCDFTDNGLLQMYTGAFGPQVSIPSYGTWFIISSIWDGSGNSSLQINNGTADTTSGLGTTGATGLGLNGWGGGDFRHPDWKVAAMIVTDVHSDATWIGNHKAWLAWYGGVTL